MIEIIPANPNYIDDFFSDIDANCPIKSILVPKIMLFGSEMENGSDYPIYSLPDSRYAVNGLFIIAGECEPQIVIKVKSDRIDFLKRTDGRCMPNNIGPDNILGIYYYGNRFINQEKITFENHINLQDVVIHYKDQPSDTSYASNPLNFMRPGMFKGCGKLKNVHILSKTTIPADCFNGCYSLDNLWIAEDVVKIEKNAFVHCEQLHTLKLKSVDQIDCCAFSYSVINELIIDSPCKTFSEKYSIKPWGIIKKNVKPDHKHPDGILYIFPKTTALYPEDVLSIGIVYKEAGMNCNLVHIDLPYVFEVGERAFRECVELKTIRIGYSSTSVVLCTRAFDRCTELVNGYIPTLCKIEKYCFTNCYKLNYLGNTSMLSCIEEGAFHNCFHLYYLNIENININNYRCTFRTTFESDNNDLVNKLKTIDTLTNSVAYTINAIFSSNPEKTINDSIVNAESTTKKLTILEDWVKTSNVDIDIYDKFPLKKALRHSTEKENEEKAVMQLEEYILRVWDLINTENNTCGVSLGADAQNPSIRISNIIHVFKNWVEKVSKITPWLEGIFYNCPLIKSVQSITKRNNSE